MAMYGQVYSCNHPVYNHCTLFTIGDKGIAVIQQRFDRATKRTWWCELDSYLVDDLYLHPKFRKTFDERAGKCTDGLYPTMTIRQLMWVLRMKPIKRERWETVFDKKDI